MNTVNILVQDKKYYLCPVMIVHYIMELVNATGQSLRETGSIIVNKVLWPCVNHQK
jgi:hypothetical protein